MAGILKTVGRYEILREIGRGGMATVYLARQTDLDRFIALKELATFRASDPSFAERFVRESRVAGSLSHPNIVTVHDSFEDDGTPYIAMEYVERGSLRGYVGQLSLAQVSGVVEGLLAGLAHAEQHGIVHRDLKPENLMVTEDGRVKIADFGIAEATTEMKTGAFVTATGHTVGNPTYMAPEQAMEGCRPLDRPLLGRVHRVRAVHGQGPVPRHRRADGDPPPARQRGDPGPPSRKIRADRTPQSRTSATQATKSSHRSTMESRHIAIAGAAAVGAFVGAFGIAQLTSGDEAATPSSGQAPRHSR